MSRQHWRSIMRDGDQAPIEKSPIPELCQSGSYNANAYDPKVRTEVLRIKSFRRQDEAIASLEPVPFFHLAFHLAG